MHRRLVYVKTTHKKTAGSRSSGASERPTSSLQKPARVSVHGPRTPRNTASARAAVGSDASKEACWWSGRRGSRKGDRVERDPDSKPPSGIAWEGCPRRPRRAMRHVYGQGQKGGKGKRGGREKGGMVIALPEGGLLCYGGVFFILVLLLYEVSQLL